MRLINIKLFRVNVRDIHTLEEVSRLLLRKMVVDEISIIQIWYHVLFFFSSRRRHTRLQGDWSSDVCSSDLFSTTIFAHTLHMKHLPPHRQVISWFVTLPQVQHHSDSKRAKKSEFFSNEGTKKIGRASCRERV